MIEHKQWNRLVRRGERLHLARIHFLPSRASRLHTHDFAELFWIESGEGRHRINGTNKKLFPGDLVFIRPSDEHQLSAADESGFRLVNLAFPVRLLDELCERHPEVARLHRPAGRLPSRVMLSELQLRTLREEVPWLAADTRRRLPLERFLLTVYLMAASDAPPRPAEFPDWLQSACERFVGPKNLAGGAPRFAELCGRSPEHVARTCRRHLGQSPTEWVNRARMEHAARELRIGSKPIVEISLECGIQTLAHFYALFRAAHGQTPRRYRLAAQRTVL